MASARKPNKTSSLVASPSENSRAKVESPWIVRVNLDVSLGQLQRPFLGSCSF